MVDILNRHFALTSSIIFLLKQEWITKGYFYSEVFFVSSIEWKKNEYLFLELIL